MNAIIGRVKLHHGVGAEHKAVATALLVALLQGYLVLIYSGESVHGRLWRRHLDCFNSVEPALRRRVWRQVASMLLDLRFSEEIAGKVADYAMTRAQQLGWQVD